jgi:predicted cupin superfamily sugar epimerase
VTARTVIETLGMKPHPEGGWYVETFRDAPEGGRGHSTAIYFLLERDQASAWHRVRDAAEIWHFYAGAPLELSIHEEGWPVEKRRLGPDLAAGQRPQAVVPAGCWQAAKSLGDWTLVGCTVAPGFDFSAFELAAPGWQPVVASKR